MLAISKIPDELPKPGVAIKPLSKSPIGERKRREKSTAGSVTKVNPIKKKVARFTEII